VHAQHGTVNALAPPLGPHSKQACNKQG
jgi:hypothetical protein